MEMDMEISKQGSLVSAANRFLENSHEERISKLEEELAKLRTQRIITGKKYISILLKQEIFSKKQGKLLRALDSCKPTHELEIIKEVSVKGETMEQQRANLRALVKSTRETIKKHKGEGIMIIRGLRGKPFKGYQLIINSHFIRNTV